MKTIKSFKKLSAKDSHTKNNYEWMVFCANSQSNTRNVLACIITTTVHAINSKLALPKMMVFVLEDDVIEYLNHNNYGASEMFGKVITYIESEIQSAISVFKTRIPHKAKKIG